MLVYVVSENTIFLCLTLMALLRCVAAIWRPYCGSWRDNNFVCNHGSNNVEYRCCRILRQYGKQCNTILNHVAGDMRSLHLTYIKLFVTILSFQDAKDIDGRPSFTKKQVGPSFLPALEVQARSLVASLY